VAENKNREFITDGPCRRVFAPMAAQKVVSELFVVDAHFIQSNTIGQGA